MNGLTLSRGRYPALLAALSIEAGSRRGGFADAAKVAALQAPGQVLLKLAATGFGVRLPG